MICTCPHCKLPLSPRSVAKAIGETLYTAAAPCRKCGNTLRYTTSGNCVKCHADRERGKPIPHKPIEC